MDKQDPTSDLVNFASQLTDLQPWQKHTLAGMAKGEMRVMMAARQAGKSMLSAAAFKRLWDDIYNVERPVEELILSTGTVCDAPYYTVEPIGGNWDTMKEWCTQSFGEAAEVWNIGKTEKFIWPDIGRWYINDRRFWFRDLKDRDWFIMKWNA